MDKNKKLRIQESITNISNMGVIPADEVQLNLDVVYNSVLNEICTVVPMESPRQIISVLKLKYGMPKKAIHSYENENIDIVNSTYMNAVGAMPLDEFGYPTDEVEAEVTGTSFIGAYKNILPYTINVNGVEDDGQGNIEGIGTVDYNKAIFKFNSDNTYNIKYKFDIYNLETSRNLVYFQKSSMQMFAEQYQLDMDSALVLNDMKSLNLQDNISNIIPQVLSQQIDSKILHKYFELLDDNTISSVTWDGSVTWPYDQGYSVTEFYEDLGTLVNLEMGKYAKKLGVIPNILICDPIGYSTLKISKHYKPVNVCTNEEEKSHSGTPKLVGYFGDAKVFVVQDNSNDNNGRIIMTYKGTSDAQSSAVYAPYIPVSLRTVTGAEGGGMMITNTAYSLGGFSFTNPDLIRGVKITNVSYPS